MQEADIWQAVLGEIELTVSHGSFVTWFKPSRFLSFQDGVATIGVSNIFVKQQMENKYLPMIKQVLAKNGLEPKEFKFTTLSSQKNRKNNQEDLVIVESLAPKSMNTGAAGKAQPRSPLHPSISHSYRHGLNERYTFDNFVVGGSNELAYAACQGIAAAPGNKYNPLFLYGGVGIGKTHLLQAVGNSILAQNPKAVIIYASTEQFVQEFVDALRYKKNTEFATRYRSADVLIMDDIQFFEGKERVQEEFFHTFNALYQANKQIIISSDKPPKDIPTLEDRLRSRFAWGMAIDMQNPDFETRCAIIQSKASDHDLNLPVDLVEYLATHVQTNIRDLEGQLNRLLAWCEMRGLEPNLAMATALLGSHKRPRHVTTKQIIEKTAKHFQVPVEDIMGPRRDKDIVVPRQVAMYIMRTDLRLSYPKIARELGRKDHTTAIHSYDKIEKEQAYDATLREAIAEIREKLNV